MTQIQQAIIELQNAIDENAIAVKLAKQALETNDKKIALSLLSKVLDVCYSASNVNQALLREVSK